VASGARAGSSWDTFGGTERAASADRAATEATLAPPAEVATGPGSVLLAATLSVSVAGAALLAALEAETMTDGVGCGSGGVAWIAGVAVGKYLDHLQVSHNIRVNNCTSTSYTSIVADNRMSLINETLPHKTDPLFPDCFIDMGP